MPPKKITAENLAVGFWEMQKKGKNTLRNWAIVPITIGSGVLLNKKDSISKQAINERLIPIAIGTNCLKMVKLIFKKALNFKYRTVKEKLDASNKLKDTNHLFNCILLQDSTIQSLLSNLCSDFPASHTNGKKAAMLRLLPIAIGIEIITNRKQC